MIERTALKTEIELALRRFRVVELVGPRQSGKTTLAREFVPFDSLNYFDLENPLHLARLDQPMVALQDLRGLVIIDEVQRRPELFPVCVFWPTARRCRRVFWSWEALLPSGCNNHPSRWPAGQK